MMKELTELQKSTLRIRLGDIVDLAERILKLTRRMKKDRSYINAQYLSLLDDDADSIKYIVDEIGKRVL